MRPLAHDSMVVRRLEGAATARSTPTDLTICFSNVTTHTDS